MFSTDLFLIQYHSISFNSVNIVSLVSQAPCARVQIQSDRKGSWWGLFRAWFICWWLCWRWIGLQFMLRTTCCNQTGIIKCKLVEQTGQARHQLPEHSMSVSIQYGNVYFWIKANDINRLKICTSVDLFLFRIKKNPIIYV